MASEKQKEAARENIQKAQKKWQEMTPEEHDKSHPESRNRAKPGEIGGGDYYRIEVRPKTEFKTLRYHDVGGPGHIQRLAGQRENGSWDDQAWLISKKDAHDEDHFLKADTKDAREIIDTYGPAHQIVGNIYQGHPRQNIPESEKPTEAQQKARMENIKKAQEARREK